MLGRCLVPSKNEGNEMTQWVLKINWKVFPWSSLRKKTIQQLEPSNEVEQQKRAVFDADIRQILGKYFSLLVDGIHLKTGDVIGQESEEFYVPTPFWSDDDEVPRSVPVADCVYANVQVI